MTERLSEEQRALLRRIVEAQAYRRLQSLNILGHCLKYVVDLETKMRIGEELDASLRLFREIRALYNDLGWRDIEGAVRDRLDRTAARARVGERGELRRDRPLPRALLLDHELEEDGLARFEVAVHVRLRTPGRARDRGQARAVHPSLVK